MAATSASHIIWFIAALIAATAVSGVMIATVFDMAETIETRGRIISGELEYDISIENDVTMVPYDNVSKNLTIYIKNIGSKEIPFDGANYTFVLFITGGNLTQTNAIPFAMSIIGTGTNFLPGRTMELIYKVSTLYSDYEYSIKVIASEYSSVGDSTYIRITNI